MHPPIDHIPDYRYIILMYAFDKDSALPQEGSVLEIEDMTMVILESSTETGHVKVVITDNEGAVDMKGWYDGCINRAINKIAERMYKKNERGMTSLIGWEKLPDENKEPYLEEAKEVLTEVNKENLLILPFE